MRCQKVPRGVTRDRASPPPWDQLPDEPDGAFARFVLYRCLGLGRSIRRAYHEWLRQRGTPCRGDERPPGAWQRYASLFRWRERARAWDVAQMEQAGQATAYSLLEAAAAAAETAFMTFGQKRPTMGEAIRLVEVLLEKLPGELLVKLVDAARSRRLGNGTGRNRPGPAPEMLRRRRAGPAPPSPNRPNHANRGPGEVPSQPLSRSEVFPMGAPAGWGACGSERGQHSLAGRRQRYL
jgi:hypothetical protein